MAFNYVEVVSYQRKFALDLEHWTRFATQAIKVIQSEIDDTRTGVTIAFISGYRMRNLNRQYRNIDRTTDVLSFPAIASAPSLKTDGYLGDIALCTTRANQQASRAGLPLESEIAQLILHGLLHLYGFDHETDNGEMDVIEMRIRRKLAINFVADTDVSGSALVS